MQSNRSIEAPDSAAPGVIPAPVYVHDDGVAAYDGKATEPTPGETSRPAEPPGASNRSLFARLLSVVRGDKYLADAYEPPWSALMARRAGASVVRPDDQRELAVDVQPAVEPQPIGAGHAAPAASPPQEG